MHLVVTDANGLSKHSESYTPPRVRLTARTGGLVAPTLMSMLTAREYAKIKKAMSVPSPRRINSTDVFRRSARYSTQKYALSEGRPNNGFSASTLSARLGALWHLPTALTKLNLTMTAFDPKKQEAGEYLSGYTNGREIAVSLAAPLPLHTLFHELGHCADWNSVKSGGDPATEFVADATGCVMMARVAKGQGLMLHHQSHYSWRVSQLRNYLCGQYKPTPSDYARVDRAVEIVWNAGT